MQMQPEMCPKCKQMMQPLACSTNPDASEWYCEKCHKSSPMDIDVASYIIASERGRKK